MNSGGPRSSSSPSFCSGSTVVREKISGSAASSSAATLSNCAIGVPSGARSATSVSEKVIEPPASASTAPMPASAAAAHSDVGAPRPMGQTALPSSPALRAAERMRARATCVFAAQASKRGGSSGDITKRSVKGVITGRGAAMSRARRRSSGARRVNSASSMALASGLSVTAVMRTSPGATEILARSSRGSISLAYFIAMSQPRGTG